MLPSPPPRGRGGKDSGPEILPGRHARSGWNLIDSPVTSDYTDTIDWGDGTTTSGQIIANGSGGFDVVGSHTYAEESTYTLAVTIHWATRTTRLATKPTPTP